MAASLKSFVVIQESRSLLCRGTCYDIWYLSWPLSWYKWCSCPQDVWWNLGTGSRAKNGHDKPCTSTHTCSQPHDSCIAACRRGPRGQFEFSDGVSQLWALIELWVEGGVVQPKKHSKGRRNFFSLSLKGLLFANHTMAFQSKWWQAVICQFCDCAKSWWWRLF